MKFNPIIWDLQTKVTTTSRFTVSAQNGRFGANTNVQSGWLASVVGADNHVYVTPRGANGVLRINPVTGTATVINYGITMTGADKWTKGILASNGKIYFSPRNAANFLVVNTLTQTAYLSNLGISLTTAVNKYNSFVRLDNDQLLLFPQTLDHCLVINTRDDTAYMTTLGLPSVPAVNYAVTASNGDIVASLNNGTGFLIIDRKALTARIDSLGMPAQTGIPYIGLIRGLDNRFYGVPYNATNILTLDTDLMLATTETFGVNLSGTDKWNTGALGPDGKIYCAPNNATDVLIIDTVNQSATRSTLGLNWTGTFKRYSSTTVGNQIWFGPGATSPTSTHTSNNITRITFSYMGDNINPQWWHGSLINTV